MLNVPILTRWVSSTPDSPWHERPLSVKSANGEVNLQLSGTQHQMWEGFGACFNELAWIALSVLSEDERGQVMENFFGNADSCCLNIGRLPIGASDYAAQWYSHNENDSDFAMENFGIERDRCHLIPFIKTALRIRKDIRLFASPWSPPTWLKFPRAYNYGTLIWKPEYLKAYALYFLKFVEAYRTENITISQIHVQNEPVADQKFPSCRWTGEQLRNFISDYLGPLFKEKAPECEIWLGTLNTADYDAYPNKVLSDPAANNFVSGVGFQWAGRGAIQRTAESWPEKRLMQTETECHDGRNTWEQARNVFSIFRYYIVNGANACVYWNMSQKPGGLSTWGWPQNALTTIDPDRGAIIYNPDFYAMKHFSHFVKVGAIRLGLRGPWTGNAVAFANTDGKTVVVISNPFKDSRKLTFGGKRGGFTISLMGNSFNTLVIEEGQ